MIRDTNGNELTFWPIANLLVGQLSEVLTIRVDTPSINGFLRSTQDARVNVWGRRKGIGAAYQNLEAAPIPLGLLAGPYTEFEIYVEAVGPITNGFERVPFTVSASRSSASGWTV